MKRWSKILDRFWFLEAPATRLALLRILVGAFSLWYLLPRIKMFTRIGRTDESLFEPVGVIEWLGYPIAPDLYQVIVLLTVAAAVAFTFGWRHRYTGPAFALLLLFTLSYRNSWSMIFHSDNVLVLHVFILGFTAAADAFSLDAISRSPHAESRRTPLPEDGRARNRAGDWSYGYPVMLMCAVTLVAYFLAGAAKLTSEAGIMWATGESLRSQIAVDALRKELLGGEAPPYFLQLYDSVGLFMIMGATSLLVEVGAPLALLNRRLGRLWAVAAFFGHWGIYFVMGITFRYQMSGIIFASFFNVERIIVWMHARYAARNVLRETPIEDEAVRGIESAQPEGVRTGRPVRWREKWS